MNAYSNSQQMLAKCYDYSGLKMTKSLDALSRRHAKYLKVIQAMARWIEGGRVGRPIIK